MTFSSSPKVRFTLKYYHTQSRVISEIGKVQSRGGGTYTHTALESLVDLMSPAQGARSGAIRIAILETDGASEKPELTQLAAQKARNAGITLICVGIGKYNKAELDSVATDPDKDHVFEVATFDGLSKIVKAITKAACSGTPPPVVATTPGATMNPADVPKYCDGYPKDQRYRNPPRYMIDPDGPFHGADPFMVECDFSGSVPVSILHNKQEKKMCITDCHERDYGCFVQTIQYHASAYQTNTFVKNALHCSMSVTYDCFNSALDYRTHDPKGPLSWWVNGKGQKVNYWPGGPSTGGCACAKTNSCAKASEKCNCDAKDNKWRQDKGTISDKSQLPITELAIGDVNGNGEQGCITVSALKCTKGPYY